MLAEKVIIHQILISKAGQLKTFQLRMPSDAKFIIGIEATVKGFDIDDGPDGETVFRFTIRPVAVAGELRLQNLGSANLFYSGEVKLSDRNLGFGDASQAEVWARKAWTHDYRREEDPVFIQESCPVIQGNYRDKIGEASHSDYEYTVTVYLWYATEKDKKS